jgi:hypothetical protein
MGRYIVQHGDEEGFHITVGREYSGSGFTVMVWHGNRGTSGLETIRDYSKARAMAEYLYENLLPEYEAEQKRRKERLAKFLAEMDARPKPKPPRIPKNAPILDVLECPDCNELILPDEVRGPLDDGRVYECGECGTRATGPEGRQCEQCHKFTAKLSDTSCPKCEAPMDDQETVQAQRATNKKLVKVGT